MLAEESLTITKAFTKETREARASLEATDVAKVTTGKV